MAAVAAGMIAGRADAQNLFVSDFWADSIYYFTPDGVRHTFATGLNRPAGIAFDKTGNLFVSDYHSGNIYKYTPNGVRSTFASGLASARVWGIAFDKAGNLYGAASDVGVPGYGSVFKWTASGQRSTFAAGLYAPQVLAFDSADNLYVSNLGYNLFTDTILRFTPGGVRSTFASGLFNTAGMAFDSAGNLFVQEAYAGSKVYKITPSGVRTTFANFYGVSLGFDSAGRLLQGDDYGNIYQLWPQGTRTLYASGLERPTSFALQVPKPPTPTAITCSEPLDLECTNGFAVGTVQTSVVDSNGLPLEVVWRVDGRPYQTNHIPSGGTITSTNVTFTANFAQGEHTVVVSVSNGQSAPASCSTPVSVRDTLPPVVLGAAASPILLWPPNGRWVPVELTVEALDGCDPSPDAFISEIKSSEPEDLTMPDWEITGPLRANLRAKRTGRGTGRIYTIAVSVRDASGNVATKSVTVAVPHDRR